MALNAMRNDNASRIAFDLMEELSPKCSKIAIGGSIRRREPEVNDIEIIAEPTNVPKRDLFGEQPHYPLLDYLREGFIARDGNGFEKRRMIKGDKRYFQFALVEGIVLDLFVVLPPAQWGVMMVIRTGPEDFSKRCVTQSPGGLMKPGYVCSEVAVRDQYSRKIIPMATEEDFFKFMGMDFIEPWKRK